MRLVGDPDGIAALRRLMESNREYLKFLVAEAGSSTDHTAHFRDPEGQRWLIVLRPTTGELDVRRGP